MSEPTVADDLAVLRRLADRLDPDIRWDATDPGTDADVDIAATLRRIAAHLDRIVTGGDRPPPAAAPPDVDVPTYPPGDSGL